MSAPPQSATSRSAEQALARFVAAREAGDEAAAREAWHELVALNFDRVRQMVRVESHRRLSPDEQEDATQQALTKLLTNMMRTFRGTTMGEWVNATRALVHGSCTDLQRRAVKHSSRRAPLDGTGHDGQETGGYTSAVNDALLDQAAIAEADADAAELYAIGAEFLDWGVPRLQGKRRTVLELDRQGMTSEQIEHELGVSRDVVYQSRRRGITDLLALRSQWRQA